MNDRQARARIHELADNCQSEEMLRFFASLMAKMLGEDTPGDPSAPIKM